MIMDHLCISQPRDIPREFIPMESLPHFRRSSGYIDVPPDTLIINDHIKKRTPPFLADYAGGVLDFFAATDFSRRLAPRFVQVACTIPY